MIDDIVRKRLSYLEEGLLARDLGALSTRVQKRRLVLFFGRPTFSDNTKYLYLHAVAAARSFDVLWCTHDDELLRALTARGLPCLHIGRDPKQTVDTLLYAAVAVFCVNPNESLRGSLPFNACLAGARKIQLWHGVSVKHLMLSLIPHFNVLDVNLRQPWELATRAEYLLSTSSQLDAFWHRCFGTRRLVRAGYPRNEVAVREPQPLELLGAELPPALEERLRDRRRRKVLVVPTWQRGKSTYMTEDPFVVRCYEYARSHPVDFFLKMHPRYFVERGDELSKAQGLYLLNPGLDVYPWLRHFDLLMTDYSSIMFDYLLTGRPVLTLDIPPDAHQRFEPDYRLIPEGRFRTCFTQADVAERITEALDADALAEDRKTMAARLFETDPAQAGAQLLRLIERLVDEAVAGAGFEVVQP